MSYATPTEFRSAFSGTGGRLATYLPPLPPANQADAVQGMLDAGAARVDGILAAARYVVPASPADGSHTAALLRARNIDAATIELCAGLDRTPEFATAAQARLTQWADDLRGVMAPDGMGGARSLYEVTIIPDLARTA